MHLLPLHSFHMADPHTRPPDISRALLVLGPNILRALLVPLLHIVCVLLTAVAPAPPVVGDLPISLFDAIFSHVSPSCVPAPADVPAIVHNDPEWPPLPAVAAYTISIFENVCSINTSLDHAACTVFNAKADRELC